jgi:hypothetical protein
MNQPHLSTHPRLTSAYLTLTRVREWVLVKAASKG